MFRVQKLEGRLLIRCVELRGGGAILSPAHGPATHPRPRDFRTGSMEGDKDHGVCSWECCSTHHGCLPGRSAEGLCSRAPVTIRGSSLAAMAAAPPPRSSLQRAGEIRWRRPGEEEGVGEPRGVFSQRKLRPQGGFQEIPTHYSSLPTNLDRLIPIGRSKNAPPWTVSQLPSTPGRYLVCRPPEVDGIPPRSRASPPSPAPAASDGPFTAACTQFLALEPAPWIRRNMSFDGLKLRAGAASSPVLLGMERAGRSRVSSGRRPAAGVVGSDTVRVRSGWPQDHR